jgi:ribonuclease III
MTDSSQNPLDRLEQLLGYTFTRKGRLQTALRHSSYVNEQADEAMEDNERYEFLGDAVVNLIVSHLLMERHPQLSEGDLSRIRSYLVNEIQLAGLARKLRLGDFILLGKGEIQTNGRNKKSILADALEALAAAVYLDGGFKDAFRAMTSLFTPLLDELALPERYLDHKSRLQELAQTRLKVTPVYRIIEENGPEHDKTFTVSLRVAELETTGSGKSKKSAEQAAARKALEHLEED